jgi:hypothetical protein
MNTARINDWLQVIGQFALVASLIFVGLQMRQTQAIALSQAYQARADQSIAVMLAGIDNDTTLSYWAKRNGSIDEELTPQERAYGIGFVLARFIHWENVHYQYQQGFVSEEHWNTLLAEMRGRLPTPEFQFAYEREPDAWRTSFREEVVEPILAGARARPRIQP